MIFIFFVLLLLLFGIFFLYFILKNLEKGFKETMEDGFENPFS
jgi:hypothetical protein